MSWALVSYHKNFSFNSDFYFNRITLVVILKRDFKEQHINRETC